MPYPAGHTMALTPAAAVSPHNAINFHVYFNESQVRVSYFTKVIAKCCCRDTINPLFVSQNSPGSYIPVRYCFVCLICICNLIGLWGGKFILMIKPNIPTKADKWACIRPTMGAKCGPQCAALSAPLCSRTSPRPLHAAAQYILQSSILAITSYLPCNERWHTWKTQSLFSFQHFQGQPCWKCAVC